MDAFFRHYLTMKISRIPKQGRVYEEFRLYHLNCEFGTIRALSSLRKAVSFTRETEQAQQAYKQLQTAIQRAELEQEQPFAYKNNLYFGV
ncbi:MAG: hypothetical protein LKE53_08300 [Oscillospiraceae bacterium]|jgi:hypothetical protein|nr:hypothetical protein [Oscillospiraceae bacterium]MDD3260459.1 hypothetical protein [Oscillospiraceae bacterium]